MAKLLKDVIEGYHMVKHKSMELPMPSGVHHAPVVWYMLLLAQELILVCGSDICCLAASIYVAYVITLYTRFEINEVIYLYRKVLE